MYANFDLWCRVLVHIRLLIYAPQDLGRFTKKDEHRTSNVGHSSLKCPVRHKRNSFILQNNFALMSCWFYAKEKKTWITGIS